MSIVEAGSGINNPIIFVTQFPIAADFATIGSTFANHSGNIASVGRGGDLYIRYPNGILRNLTQEAGYGNTGFQGNNAIAVRDPHVHWSGQKALFSMVIGAPQQFQFNDYYWQIYEITGFGQGETVSITKLSAQPADYNNITPIYGSDGSVIFTSDMPRTRNRFNYPQYDEYESTPTNTGLWKLHNGQVSLLQHSPSGSFTPIIDSFGRIVYTRWDHLQQDQQASPVNSTGAFNYSHEGPGATIINSVQEVFPEPRAVDTAALAGANMVGHRINHFFPWQLNQDGTEEETLNHIGRHELHSYFQRSFNDDNNLQEFIAPLSRPNQSAIENVFHMHEDPNQPGRYLAIDAPEFQTHSAGMIVAMELPPGANPYQAQMQYITHESTRNVVGDSEVAPVEHVGFFRNPITMHNGMVISAHTAETRRAYNEGDRPNPQPRYDFTLKTLKTNGQGDMVPDSRLTNLGSVSISYYDPDVLVTYNGPLWELSPVEVVVRHQPPMTTEIMQAPEAQIFAEENIDSDVFKNFLKSNNLAVVVMRDVTTRDELDIQQPYNLKVADSVHQTIGSPGKIYDISHMQFVQGDQVRGYGGINSPDDGQRVLAQFLHDENAMQNNIPFANAPEGSAEISEDGSVAFFVPARRAMSWQSLAPDGEPVVRERYWITFQPGEIRVCGGCHGVNEMDQAGALPSLQKAEAFRDLLQYWNNDFEDVIFVNGFDE